jgi:murein DD-endopeptidase MepM/ murein hydrolase activator NlpD
LPAQGIILLKKEKIMPHTIKKRCLAPLLVLLFFIPGGFGPASVSAQQPRFALTPENPRPGEPVTIAVASGPEGGARGMDGGDIRAVLVTREGRLSRTVFFDFPTSEGELPFKAAILPIPSTARPGPASVRIESPSALIAELPLTITPRDFVSEEIALDPVNTDIRTAPDPRKTAESELLWAILNRTGADIYVHEAFAPPVASTRRTSFFGDRRVFKYSNGKTDTAIHAGIDYGVPRGTAVTACAGGKVVLARFRIVTGNSVIIEHLPGVYSLYYHLDKIEVKEGELVRTGVLLGQSGSTGLATGPHLHWEIRVAGENTDPDAFVSRPILDKDAILTKINVSAP